MAFKDFSLENMNTKVVGVGGLAVVAVFLLFAFGVGTLGLLQARYTMSGVFDQVAGLKVGADVRRAGVDIGNVTAIEPVHGEGHVIVHWTVDNDVRLGPGTRAEIAAGTIFGNEFLRLTGPVQEPFLGDGAQLDPDHTYTALQLVEAFDTTTRALGELDVPMMSDALGKLGEVGSANIGELDGLFDGLEAVTAVIEERDDDIRRLLANSQELADLLRSKETELFRLVDAASVLLGEIEARRDVLARVLGDGADAVATLTNFVQEHREQVEAIIGDINTVLVRADQDRAVLNQALTFLGPGIDLLARASEREPGQPVEPGTGWFNIVLWSLGAVDASPTEGGN